jgi:outer membrane cobalamin receptor
MTKNLSSSSQLKYFLLPGLFLITFQAAGQLSFTGDTIRINEVVISSRQISSAFPGFKTTYIDTTLLKKYNLSSLAELLTACSTVFIKSYGSGGSSTASLRGTGASHTQVSWNGINISNPMLGQTDFSLITPMLTDNIQISVGGASLETGIGGIGGIINLENKPSWGKQSQFTINPGFGSFGNYLLLAGFKTGNDHFQSVTRAHLNYSENDFPYLNTEIGPEPVWEKRSNSRLSHKDFLQELYLKKQKDIFSARIWYQSANRELPGSMLIQSGVSGEEQFDESLRSVFSYDTERGKNDFYLRGAWIFNRLNYSNQLASIESKSSVHSLILNGGFETRILKGTELKVLINEELNSIRSNNYKSPATGNIASFTFLAERKSGSRMGSTLAVKEIIDNTRFLIPDFAAGLEFRLFPGEDHFLRAGISRTSHIPSMNDRYWYPGGNENLRNEYAYLFDLGYKLSQKISSSISLNTELGLFKNLIRDMIQWHPGDYSYWIAENISRVNTSGIESSISLRFHLNDLKINFNASYSYTKAISTGAGSEPETQNQLMYIPENQVNGSLFTGYKNFYFVWMTCYTGIRYITIDNSHFLPGYSVSNIICGTNIPFKASYFDLKLTVENIFNVSYQAIAYYPQPGRSFNISILYQFNKQVKR